MRRENGTSQYDHLKTVYYRGSLCSCNYQCAYCPFRSRKSDLAADESALFRFVREIPRLAGELTVVFTPRGEAMIHDYYHRAMRDISGYDHVQQVCCQTNLSFDIEKFANVVRNPEKISLWCSFHPSQTTPRDFLRQCGKLSSLGISFCVGSVAHPESLAALRLLRRELNGDVYMWINALEGFGRKYTKAEIDSFREIDPLFELELQTFKADQTRCVAGRESIFAEENGDFFACPISKVKLGNLYSEEAFAPEKICRAKKCGCWLAYSNRIEARTLFLSQDAVPLRNPSARKAVFFDVDGTLTDASGHIPGETITAIKALSESALIFLATSLPFEYARKTCDRIWDYLAGGAFAEGSDIQIFASAYRKIVPLSETAFHILPTNCSYEAYRHDGVLHKITVSPCDLPDCAEFHIVRADVIGIVSKEASKLCGVLHLCEKLRLLACHVTVVGDSENDVPMLRYFENSVAVSNASAAAKEAANLQVTSIREICF